MTPSRSVNNTMTNEDHDQYHDAIGEQDDPEDVTINRASSTPAKTTAHKPSHGGTLGNLLGLNKSPSASS
jgi:hypothetical protein